MKKFRVWFLRWLTQDQRQVDLWSAPRKATADYLLSLNPPEKKTHEALLVAQAPWASRSRICPLWDFEHDRMTTVELHRRGGGSDTIRDLIPWDDKTPPTV
jgi:hypothetical protein